MELENVALYSCPFCTATCNFEAMQFCHLDDKDCPTFQLLNMGVVKSLEGMFEFYIDISTKRNHDGILDLKHEPHAHHDTLDGGRRDD